MVWGMSVYPFQGEGHVAASGPSYHKDKTQSLVSLFGFWRQFIPHLGMLFQPIYPVIRKPPSFF